MRVALSRRERLWLLRLRYPRYGWEVIWCWLLLQANMPVRTRRGGPVSMLRLNAAALEGLSDQEQRQALEEFKQLEKAVKENPLLVYKPHRRQREFHAAPHPPLRAFFGGNRSGKTTATMVDTILQLVDVDVVPEALRAYKVWEPPFYGRVVTPDLTNTLEGVVLQKFREWCPRGQFKGGSFDRAYDKVLRTLHFKNGSWVQFFSNDQDLDKFGGAALHRVVYDEEPRADIRRESLMRLIDYGGDEVFGMTPLHGLSWTYDQIYEPWERSELEDGRVVVVDMDDNPHLDEVTKKRVLAGLSEEEREARKSGRFVSFSGLIYPTFSALKHVVRDEELPEGVEVFAGIDPGIRTCAVLFCYLDVEDRLVVFDEIAAKGQTVKEVCHEIDEKAEFWGRRPSWFVIDPAARNRNSQTGRSDQAEFSDHGVVTIPGQNAWRPGVNRVKERLEAEPARLLVSARCEALRGEFKRYRFAAEGRSENEKERPVKKDDHLLDALRYVVMQRPLVPETQLERPYEAYHRRALRKSFERLKSVGRQPDHPSGAGIYA